MALDPNASALLKTRAIDKFEDNVLTGNVVTGLIEKKMNTGGKTFQVALQLSGTIARGARFADAVANVSITPKVEVDYVYQNSYTFGYADGISAALAKGGGENAIVDLLGVEQDVAYSTMGQLIEGIIVRGDSYGTMVHMTGAPVSGTTGVVVVQADHPQDLYSIYIGDILASKTDPTTASLQTGTWKVTALDPLTGLLTITAQGGADATAYNGNSFGLSATYANSTARQTMHSLRTMFTRTALTTPFDGIADRSSDPVRLAGNVFNAPVGTNAIDCIRLGVSAIGNFASARPDYAIVSTNTWNEVETLLADRVRYTIASGSGKGMGAGIDYPSITFNGPKGLVTVVASPVLPDNEIFVIDTSSLMLTSATEDLITPLDNEDAGWIQLQGADARRLSLRHIGAFICWKFWANARIIRS